MFSKSVPDFVLIRRVLLSWIVSQTRGQNFSWLKQVIAPLTLMDLVLGSSRWFILVTSKIVKLLKLTKGTININAQVGMSQDTRNEAYHGTWNLGKFRSVSRFGSYISQMGPISIKDWTGTGIQIQTLSYWPTCIDRRGNSAPEAVSGSKKFPIYWGNTLTTPCTIPHSATMLRLLADPLNFSTEPDSAKCWVPS